MKQKLNRSIYKQSGRFFRISLTAPVVLVAFQTANAQFIQNGSFDAAVEYFGLSPSDGPEDFTASGWDYDREATFVNFTPPRPGYITVATGPTNVYYGNISPVDGSNFLTFYSRAITGPTTNSVGQSLTGLTVGDVYTVNFSYAGVTGLPAGSMGTWTAQILDGASGPVQATSGPFDALAGAAFALSPNTPFHPTTYIAPWAQGSITFQATSATNFLKFIGIAAGEPTQLFLDGITVTRVPEPSSVLMGTLALSLAMVYRRRS